MNVTGTGMDLGKSYISFVRINMDIITKRIADDLWVLNAMEVINYIFFFFSFLELPPYKKKLSRRFRIYQRYVDCR